jgi:hypothetical protein
MGMAKTLASLRDDVSRRLGDPAYRVWTQAEIALALQVAYRHVALAARTFWDQVYLENLPRGFNYTAAWEQDYLEFDDRCANFTFEDERRLINEDLALGPANHTSPCEIPFLSAAKASTEIPAVADLPETLTELDRAVWDQATLTALMPQTLARSDSRYEITKGEVYGFVCRKDGIRSFRKVRVPAMLSDQFTVEGSWGLLRDPAEVSTETVTGAETLPACFSMTESWEHEYADWVYDFGAASFTMDDESSYAGPDALGPANHTSPFEASVGYLDRAWAVSGWAQTWGVPRLVPGHHPMGSSQWGAPRRFYADGKNVRVEYWRTGEPLVNDSDVCELPDRYALYLRDYAQARCLARSGPGQDRKLAAHYDQRWARGLARVHRRMTLIDVARVGVLGGNVHEAGLPPPRPRLPWNYGQRVRP